MRRTLGWWVANVALALGIAAAGTMALVWVIVSPAIGIRDRLGVAPPLVLFGLAVFGCAVGSVWLIRIVREARDEPPPWRYRDD